MNTPNYLMIQHVSLIIADIDISKHYYVDVLGMRIDQNRPEMKIDGFWLSINSEQQIHLLRIDNPDSIKRPEHGGRDRHVALKVNDLNLIKNRLDNNNIDYRLSSSGRQALFCRDPDGNTLELLE